MYRLVFAITSLLTFSALASEWRIVPNEPRFTVVDSTGASLGVAEFYRMSTQDGLTYQDTEVFKAAKRKKSARFLEFLALRIFPEKPGQPMRYIYIGFRKQGDPGVAKLYRILEAITLFQLDHKLGAVELNFTNNLTRKKEGVFGAGVAKFHLIEPAQISLQINGQRLEMTSLLQEQFTVDPYQFIRSLLSSSKTCEKLAEN